MSKRAWAYIWLVFLIACLLVGMSYRNYSPTQSEWQAFAILTTLAILAQLFKSEAPNHQLYHPTLVFTFAGVLILQPFLFAVMVVIYHLIEWSRERLANSHLLRDWWLQPFNIATHIIAGLIAQMVYISLQPELATLIAPITIFTALLAAIASTLINHLLIGQALVLARGVSWRESGILGHESLLTDFLMLVMGINVAILLSMNPWLILPAIAPFYLIYRALAVPSLKQQASTDPKTGLWNTEYFMKVLQAELNRSTRFERPLTVVVADLDLLRNINNAYGHLAGDAVLIGVANILRNFFRDYDVVSRFGGEEFAIMMPETAPQEAYWRIEAVRKAIEAAVFESPTTQVKIKATMSFGVAGATGGSQNAKELLHSADVAVYEAKMKGRNCSRIYSQDSTFAHQSSVDPSSARLHVWDTSSADSKEP